MELQGVNTEDAMILTCIDKCDASLQPAGWDPEDGDGEYTWDRNP